MGSANINDRSQKGNGDSEIALVVEDEDMIDSRMNGKSYRVSRFATTLRRRLYKGLLPLYLLTMPLIEVKNTLDSSQYAQSARSTTSCILHRPLIRVNLAQQKTTQWLIPCHASWKKCGMALHTAIPRSLGWSRSEPRMEPKSIPLAEKSSSQSPLT